MFSNRVGAQRHAETGREWLAVKIGRCRLIDAAVDDRRAAGAGLVRREVASEGLERDRVAITPAAFHIEPNAIGLADHNRLTRNHNRPALGATSDVDRFDLRVVNLHNQAVAIIGALTATEIRRQRNQRRSTGLVRQPAAPMRWASSHATAPSSGSACG